ncbi:MAG: LysM peptidoglycan-binding domain-containing protein [Chloroflexota bacterium]|nr:LysM peptidoglycan-binding domain-containing protein [Chloroflexota bacterium]
MKRLFALVTLCLAVLLATTALPASADTSSDVAAQTYITYIVQYGDRLSGIAQRYCSTWQEIYNLNAGVIGSNPNYIRAGIALTIPNRCGISGVYDRGATWRAGGAIYGNVYYVVYGDWLNYIARRFGVTTQQIVQANAVMNPNRIEVGQPLIIPGLNGGIVPPPYYPPTPYPTPYYPPPVYATPTPPMNPPPPPQGCVLTAISGFALYQAPDFTAPVVGFVNAGQQASVRNRTVDASGFQWYQVDVNSVTGWLAASALEVSVTGACP